MYQALKRPVVSNLERCGAVGVEDEAPYFSKRTSIDSCSCLAGNDRDGYLSDTKYSGAGVEEHKRGQGLLGLG
ncbi:hypothetical protein HYQ46_011978 [Verticillium longisporum]|nr:hypothetical protein HYQ46_011978 [Verticillium longisporum]